MFMIYDVRKQVKNTSVYFFVFHPPMYLWFPYLYDSPIWVMKFDKVFHQRL